MSLLKLPEIKADSKLSSAEFDMRPDALERWEPQVMASASSEPTISIYDPIGERWDGEGVTAKRISAALHSIGDQDVTVNINSPGGNFFEGVAIYNLLREHPYRVTVRVMGLAASAASVIAMAGDDILMGEGAFLMIHNAWAVAVGNRHDMAAVAKTLAPFDEAMARLYAARSGMSVKDAATLMDEETWLSSERAVDDGFATGLLSDSDITRNANALGQQKYLALVEASMAKAGHSRSMRRDIFKNLFSGTPSAAGRDTMPRAGADLAASLQTLLSTVKGNV